MQAVRGGQGCEGEMNTGHSESDAEKPLHSQTDSQELALIRSNTDHRSSQLVSGRALLASPTLPALGRKWSWGPSGRAAAEQGLGALVQLCSSVQGDPADKVTSRAGEEAAIYKQ